MKKIFILFMLISIVSIVSCNRKNASVQPNDDDMARKTNRISVVYFSHTGNTKKVANDIAVNLNSKTFEIIPAVPYTSDDVNYKDSSSRVSAEFANDALRPEIANDLSEAMSSDIILVGYPIWKNAAPRIIYSFFDNYNLVGKKIFLFCTSGSSQIKNSIDELRRDYPELNFVDGMRIEVDNEKTIKNWCSRVKR